MPQLDMFAPASRATDPVSSFEAEERVTESGSRKRQMDEILDTVRCTPGRTSLELSTRLKLDRYQVARRLPDLERANLVNRGAIRVCSIAQTKAVTWWPR